MPADNTPAASTYVFDNAAAQTRQRFESLARLHDPTTFRHLEARGVKDGWRCLEVGGGGGSVVTWLSQRVGRTGRVVVTDIDIHHLTHLNQANVEFRQHDIVRDALEEGAFDLVYTRLVLQHIPERAQALQRMLAALKPGGWVVIEDYDAETDLSDPARYPGEQRIDAWIVAARLMTARGVDLRFGRRVVGLLKATGLGEVEAEGSLVMYQAHSPGTLLMRANLEQLRSALVATGTITDAELDKDLADVRTHFINRRAATSFYS